MEIKIWHHFQGLFTVVGGACGAFLGGWDGFLYTLITLVVVDYITGVLVAIDRKQLSSEIGYKGIEKKVVIFFLVAVANEIDMHILKSGEVLRTAVIFFYISNEGISIIENASLLGIPVPKKLKDVLEQLKDEEDD